MPEDARAEKKKKAAAVHRRLAEIVGDLSGRLSDEADEHLLDINATRPSEMEVDTALWYSRVLDS